MELHDSLGGGSLSRLDRSHVMMEGGGQTGTRVCVHHYLNCVGVGEIQGRLGRSSLNTLAADKRFNFDLCGLRSSLRPSCEVIRNKWRAAFFHHFCPLSVSSWVFAPGTLLLHHFLWRLASVGHTESQHLG